jgi:ADP-ribosylglycohydrolase
MLTSDKLAGLLYGSFIAEALSLGVHWIYDPAVIVKKYGVVREFYAPGTDSYHPKKKAGEQGHVGDQALRLMDYLTTKGGWDAAGFMEHWVAMWPTYGDYVDKATKATLANLQAGQGLTASGSPSDELAGPARIAPLLALLPDSAETAALEQTLLTHRSPEASEVAVFLAKACQRLVAGAELVPTLAEFAPKWAWEQARQEKPDFGLACSISQALPFVLWIARQPGITFEEAATQNAMAGGDNCARGLALGMLLGAAQGKSAIPQRWIDGLVAKDAIERFLA